MSEELVPQRDPKTGYFLPGNKMSKGNPLCGKVMKLKSAILEAADPADVKKVLLGLLDIALTDPSSKTRISASVEYLNFTTGRPTQSVALDVSTNDAPAVPLNLDAEDYQALERMRQKLRADVVDAEYEVKPANGDN